MALIGANELKRKMLITVDKQSYAAIEVNFSSPSGGKGNISRETTATVPDT
jgi:hypothetical protein